MHQLDGQQAKCVEKAIEHLLQTAMDGRIADRQRMVVAGPVPNTQSCWNGEQKLSVAVEWLELPLETVVEAAKRSKQVQNSGTSAVERSGACPAAMESVVNRSEQAESALQVVQK